MTDHDESLGPEGYQVDAVEAWIADNVEGLTPPLKWTRLRGGHSNLTYRIGDQDGNQAVIRRPPQGQLLPKAHDMSREWSLISSLGPTAVPVPKAIGFCESPDVTGAWFYIMGHIEGHPLYSADDTNKYIPQDQREKMAHSFIDVLASLHVVNVAKSYIAKLAKTSAPKAIAASKRLVYRHLGTTYETALREAELVQNDFLLAPDSTEGASSFIEKRDPHFERVGE